MKGIAIKVEGLGKKYRIGRKRPGSIKESLTHVFQRRISKDQVSSDFWALKDINFTIKHGEAVGVIGRNGAGKSTLLKILSRITTPTTGRFEINGRVSFLLEVGTGFHMELTGRDNIFLNGTILGMKRTEIKAKFDEIVAFSGVEEFIDTPVKHYSSGMKVRLAFSVAAHLEPEILIVDEVLAVGDAEFQRKCIGKMKDVAGQGRTVLFVSHNMGAVEKLCEKCIALNKGSIFQVDKTKTVIYDYLNFLNKKSDLIGRNEIESNDKIIKNVEIVTKDGQVIHAINQKTAFVVKIRYESSFELFDPHFGIQIADMQGQNLIWFQTKLNMKDVLYIPKSGIALCEIKHLPLIEGKYFVNVGWGDKGIQKEYFERVLSFEIVNSDYFETGNMPKGKQSLFLLHGEWSFKQV